LIGNSTNRHIPRIQPADDAGLDFRHGASAENIFRATIREKIRRRLMA
jgi:hypothetical protein